MKLRYYVRGFGAGLVVAAIVLFIAGKIGPIPETKNSSEQETTAGSVLAYTKTEVNNDETTAESVTKTVAATTTVKETEKETTATQTTATTAAATTAATTATTAKEKPAKGTAVTIAFYDVYTAYQACDILYEAGVIDDKDGFFNYMYRTGMDTKMKNGDYTIIVGDSFENIARIITRS